MKQLFPFLCWLLMQNVQAQTFPYEFSVANGTYTPLTNAVSVNNGLVWDDLDAEVPIGFSFEFFGETTSSLFYYGGAAINMLGLEEDPTPLIISYGTDLIDRGFDENISKSPISYKTEGAPGSRIFKMEWANAGFFDDNSGGDFTNTQLWLHEGSNIVELHFGPTQVNNPESFLGYTGPLFGFMDSYSFLAEDYDNLWYLVGPANNPTIKKVTGLTVFDTLQQTVNGAPGNGLIYRFTPDVVGLDDPLPWDKQVRVFPTVATGMLTVAIDAELIEAGEEVRYALVDQLGRQVLDAPLPGAVTQIDVSTLPPGLYYLSLRSEERMLATRKVVKQ